MVKLDYVTKQPKDKGIPRVILSDLNNESKYKLILIDKINNEEIIFSDIKDGIYTSNKQWFSDWEVILLENDELVYHHKTDLNGKSCFIKIDSYALGDTLAWIPYVDEFRIKHNCTVICSTFHNDLIKDSYPNILFVQPNLTISNIYYQTYIGASNDDNKIYSPTNMDFVPLQSIACNILGLDYKEKRPILENTFNSYKHNKNYVCISEFASNDVKMWKEIDGWQKVVDYLVNLNYDVFVISKEKTSLKNIIDLSGNYPLSDRCTILKNAKLFIGVSSGLSWLAWSMGVHVLLISDVTPMNHEFNINTTRLNANKYLKNINYEISEITNHNSVISEIDKLF